MLPLNFAMRPRHSRSVFSLRSLHPKSTLIWMLVLKLACHCFVSATRLSTRDSGGAHLGCHLYWIDAALGPSCRPKKNSFGLMQHSDLPANKKNFFICFRLMQHSDLPADKIRELVADSLAKVWVPALAFLLTMAVRVAHNWV